MTIDEKVSAVEEFLDWREEAGITTPLAHSVLEWRFALQAARNAEVFEDLRREAEFARGNPEEAAALLERTLRRLDEGGDARG